MDAATADLDAARIPERRRWATLAVLCVSLTVVSIDNTILATTLPTLSQELQASTTDLSWIVDAYTVMFASLLLTMGALADRRGRKGILQIGLCAFFVTSLGAAFASSPTELILWRLAMGASGAMIMPATLSILMHTFPKAEQAKALGIWTATLGLGIAIGPLAGGVLLNFFWWGSVFLVNLPVIAAALLAGRHIVPTSRDPHAKKPDWPGTALWTLGIAASISAIILAGEHRPSVREAGLLLFGFILIVVFFWWERRTDHPMLDVGLFRNPRFTAANTAVALTQFALYGVAFIATQYLQEVLNFPPLETGLALLPAIVTAGGVSLLSETVINRLGTRIAVTSGLLVVSAGLFVGSFLQVNSHFSQIALLLGLVGIGLGLALTPAEEAVLGSVPDYELGVGSGMNDTTLELGGAIGVAVLGTILSRGYHHRIHRLGLPEPVEAIVRRSIGAADQVAAQAPAELKAIINEGARLAFVHAMRMAFWVATLVVLIGACVAAFFLPGKAERDRELADAAAAAADAASAQSSE